MTNTSESGKIFKLCGALSLSAKWRNWIKLFASFCPIPEVYMKDNKSKNKKYFWEIMELTGVGIIELWEEHH